MKSSPRILLLLLSVICAVALAEETVEAGGGESLPASGPSVEAYYIYLAPTVARLHGAGFSPGESLWLDVTDPLGNTVTALIAAGSEGRFVADVAVDEPGVYLTHVRDIDGQVLSEGNLLVGLQ